MNNKFIKASGLSIVLFLLGNAAFAQLTGTKTIPGDYATINAAITDLNTAGVGTGGVIFNVAAGYTETIAATLSITTTGTAANPIVFQRSGVGANPLITAYTGGTGTPATAVQDGIWNLVGSDYVTINGISLTENGANSGTALMEYGYALYKASATNGCQHDTIMNCTVTLNRDNVTTGIAPMLDGSVGILIINSTPAAATTPLTITAIAGSNSFNKLYANTTNNTNIGIGLSGYAAASPYTNADYGNDIGGTSLSTGNTVKNFGGGIATTNSAAGIVTAAQYDLNISYNTVNSNDGAGVTHNYAIRGIYIKAANAASATITYNTVTVLSTIPNQANNVDIRVSAIENDGGSTGTSNTVNISNNTITNSSLTWLISTSTATNGLFGILNTASPSKLNIKQNVFSGNSMNTTVGNTNASMIYNRGAVRDSLTVDGNSFPSFTALATAATGLNIRYIFNFPPTYNANCATTFTNNSLTGFTSLATGAATGYFAFIFNVEEGSSLLIKGNTISNISAPTTSLGVFGIYNNANTGTTDAPSVIIENNSISNFTKTGAGNPQVIGIYDNPKNSGSSTGTVLINNNSITGLSNVGTGITVGTYIIGASNIQPIIVTNNTYSNITSGTGICYGVYGSGGNSLSHINGNTFSSISGAGNVFGYFLGNGNAAIGQNVYNNIVSGLSSTGAASTVTGIHLTQGQNMSFYKNKIYDLTANGGTGKSYGINITGATSTAGTNINIYNNLINDLKAPASSGATDAVVGIYLSNAITLATMNVSYNNIQLNAAGGAVFYTSAIYHTANATATTTKLVLRNNILVNTSTPSGGGVTAVIRRSAAATTANFDAGSDNNLLYAGTPGANNVLYSDGTNNYQNTAQYTAAFPSQGAHTVTDNVTFISTAGASPDFLRPSLVVPTPIESGGVAIAGITDDYDGIVRNTIPDIGAYEGNYVGVDSIPPVITFTPLNNTASTANRVIPAFATIADPAGINITAGTNPRIYFKKKTDANAILGNTPASNGWKYVEATNTSSAFDFTIDYSLLQTAAAIGDTIEYFVVAQDMATIPNAGANSSVLFSSKPSGVALTGAQAPVLGSWNSYAITAPLAGPIFVGVGQAYTSLTNNDAFGLFKAINLGTVTGDMNAIVVSDLNETGAISLNKWNEEGVGNYSLSITPNSATERLILGSNTTLVGLTGATKVSFNGNFGGSGKYFRFRNTNIAAASTFSFSNEAKKDTIMNCYVEGAGNSSGGVIVLGTSNINGGTGNDSIVVTNNIIRDRSDVAGVPTYLIRCGSTAGWENDSVKISNNEFMNWTGEAIAIGTGGNGGDHWIISNNSFYQTAARTGTLFGIRLYSNAGGGHTISGNSIGGSAPDRSGAAMSSNTTSSFGMAGISSVSSNIGNPLLISNNTISNIANTSSNITPIMYGITVTGSATITGNTIGGAAQPYDTIRGSGPTAGIFISSGNNTVSNNTIKNIASYTSGLVAATGIFISGGTYTVNNNIIDNIKGTSTYANVNAGSSSIPAGIVIGGSTSSGNTVSNNTISNISSLNSAVVIAPSVVAGILTTSGVTLPIQVFNNKISNVYGVNNTANFGNNVFGIVDVGGSGANNLYYNNQVILGSNVTNQSWIRGISYNSALGQQCSFYNNSVVLNAALNSANGAAAFYRLSTPAPILRNNIFYNLCTNAGAGPVSAMHNASTAVGWDNSASDYNLMYSNNPAALNYWGPSASSLSYANWITTTGGDINSVTGTVPFTSSTDLHIVGTLPDAWNVFGRGIALPSLVSNDFDGDVRSIIVGAPVTIGFDEITVPASTPADMTVTPATPIVGTPTVFTSAGRKIAEINWTGATAPTSLAAKYYPGVQAPGTPGGYTYEFSHIVITATPDSGDSYVAKIYYTHAEDNTIPDLGMNSIKKHNTDPYVPMGTMGTSTTDANGRYVITHTVTNFSIITLSNHPGIVAIKLIDIRAVNAGSSNRIDWSTAGEIISDKFELEYSLDGTHFSLLSALHANGQPSAYTSWDTYAAPGKTYYRLRMLSATGDIAYSKIVWAVKQDKNIAMTAYPNPVTDKLVVQLAGIIPANADIQLIDIAGKLLQTTAVTGNIAEINMSRFSAGIYFVKYVDGDRSKVIKIVKQ